MRTTADSYVNTFIRPTPTDQPSNNRRRWCPPKGRGPPSLPPLHPPRQSCCQLTYRSTTLVDTALAHHVASAVFESSDLYWSSRVPTSEARFKLSGETDGTLDSNHRSFSALLDIMRCPSAFHSDRNFFLGGHCHHLVSSVSINFLCAELANRSETQNQKNRPFVHQSTSCVSMN